MANTKISALTAATTPLAGTEVLPIVQSGVTKKVAVSDLTAGRAVSVASLSVSTITGIVGSSGDLNIASNWIYFKNTAGSTEYGRFTSAGDFNIGGGPGLYKPRSGTMSGGFAIGDGTGWYYAWKDTAGNTLATLDDSGVYTFKGNFVQGTAAKGINFTANSAAAGKTSQLLNWYEEGTWTPTLVGATTAGSYTLTTSTAKYIRIGKLVYVSFYALITTNSAGTGTARFGGLPYPKGNANIMEGTIATEYIAIASTIKSLTAGWWTSSSDSTFYIAGVRDNTSLLDITCADLGASARVSVNLTYITD